MTRRRSRKGRPPSQTLGKEDTQRKIQYNPSGNRAPINQEAFSLPPGFSMPATTVSNNEDDKAEDNGKDRKPMEEEQGSSEDPQGHQGLWPGRDSHPRRHHPKDQAGVSAARGGGDRPVQNAASEPARGRSATRRRPFASGDSTVRRWTACRGPIATSALTSSRTASAR